MCDEVVYGKMPQSMSRRAPSCASKYPPAGNAGSTQRAARVAQVGQQGLPRSPGARPGLRRRGRRRAVEPAQAEALPLEQGLQLLLRRSGSGGPRRAGPSCGICPRKRARCLDRGAVFVRAEPRLLQRVLLPVPGAGAGPRARL